MSQQHAKTAPAKYIQYSESRLHRKPSTARYPRTQTSLAGDDEDFNRGKVRSQWDDDEVLQKGLRILQTDSSEAGEYLSGVKWAVRKLAN
ncbi:hypothetical protein E4U19_006211 [Claviceps sp. Clav32 group G5]|nr:hypothetical protein E4U19_006211 [Claviceps sp. Clav32 group G5]KAG6048617.1 hypothetical protein E4U39_007204 [Claviceps sp. Clav50 group G5]